MFLCKLEATPNTVGIIYDLVNKARGTIIDEDVIEGTQDLSLRFLVPLNESIKFTEQIMSRCSGMSYPQLVFNGFEVNTNDPFFIPLNLEQIEEDGDGDILVTQPSKVIIESVRKRKGLVVDEVLVADVTKERTLTKNK